MKTHVTFQEKPQWQEQPETAVLEETADQKKLVVHNDDFNTFDFVIESLIEICHHTEEQAQQCTLLIHYKGKCTVKTGELSVLKPMHQKLLSRSLTSEIV